MNPIDAALNALGHEEVEKDAFPRRRKKGKSPYAARAKREMEMWHQWNDNGRQPNHIRPLLHSLQPFVKNRMRTYERRIRDIAPDTIRAEFQDQVVRAISQFDPNRGTKLTTYVDGQMRKASRFINTYQNPARIIETRTNMITPVQAADEHLTQVLGRSPTSHEIADHAKLPVNDVMTLQRELRRAVPSGQLGAADPSAIVPSRTKEIMRLLPYDLTGDENAVFERVYGMSGRKQMGTGQIARDLKMSAPKVSRLKKSIAQKWKTYSG